MDRLPQSNRDRIRHIVTMIRRPLDELVNPSEIQSLKDSGEDGRKVANAIDMILDASIRPIGLQKVEIERQKMLSDISPLSDSSLGAAGVYDAGETIASAATRSKPPRAAMMLHLLAKAFDPRSLVELGTNVGISSAYLGLGQTAGRLTTLDSSPYRLRLAKRLHAGLGLEVEYVQGLFTETLSQVVDRAAPIDMAFIDGHHQYQPTIDYFRCIAAAAASHCVFIFDDIRWSRGMYRAWKELRRAPEFSLVVDFGSFGVCVRGGAGNHRTAVLRGIV